MIYKLQDPLTGMNSCAPHVCVPLCICVGHNFSFPRNIRNSFRFNPTRKRSWLLAEPSANIARTGTSMNITIFYSHPVPWYTSWEIGRLAMEFLLWSKEISTKWKPIVSSDKEICLSALHHKFYRLHWHIIKNCRTILSKLTIMNYTITVVEIHMVNKTS